MIRRKQVISFLVLTVIVVCALTVLVGTSIGYVNKQVKHTCFDRLESNSKQLAEEIHRAIDADRIILSAMAEIISTDESYDAERLCKLMQTYTFDSSYVSYVELLQADGTMLHSDGTERDVSGAIDFAAEARKGRYVSNAEISTQSPNEKVIRNAVPIVRDGETVAILFGVARLSDLARNYTTDMYNGNAYVYVVDGTSGDFLLDTWHKELGNIYSLGSRKTLVGYSIQKLAEDLRGGVGGQIAFVSKTTGTALYLHYEPIGINNWSVMLAVEEKYSMNESKAVSGRLYVMAALIFVVLLIYMGFVIIFMAKAYKQVKRVGSEDRTTGIFNRNAYDDLCNTSQSKTFPLLTCAYIDVNGLHEINNRFGHKVGDNVLRTVADALRREFARNELFRIGGDEFVVISEHDDLYVCTEKMARVNADIEAHEYHVSIGVASHSDELGLDRITHEADELMLQNKRDYYRLHDRRRR